MFEFDPFEKDKSFYYKLFDKLYGHNLDIKFFSATLPPRELMLKMKKTFSSSTVSLNIDTCNEVYRKKLSSKELLRPFFTNHHVEKVLSFLQENNQIAQIYLIAGLPWETDQLFEYNINYINRLLAKYTALFCPIKKEPNITCTPLSVEPGSDLHTNPEKYSMHLYRKEFNDFYNLSKSVFLNSKKYPFAGFKEKQSGDIKHPYGVASNDSSEGEVYKKTMRFYDSIK